MTTDLEKGNQMRSIFRVIFILLFAIMSAGFLSLSGAEAEEGTCILEANQDVFVIVWDQDDEGNKGRQIWQGRINRGKTVKITAPHGQIRYSYNDQPDEDQPLTGDTDRSCNGDETILVP
jgi:hypothetical protein